MKLKIWVYITLLIGLFSCSPNEVDPQTSGYKPVLIDRDAANNAIRYGEPISTIAAGKFYIYKTYIYVAEKNKGYHVIENSNPDNPVKIGFLHVLNSGDLAIKDDVIYASQSVDMLAIDAKSFNNITLLSRLPNVSNEITPDNLPLNDKYKKNRPLNTIVIDWEKIK